MAAPEPSTMSAATTARLSALAVLLIWVSFILVARGSARATLTALDIAWLRFAFSGLVVLPLAWHFRRALMGGLAAGVDAVVDADVDAGRARGVALRRALSLAYFGGLGYCLFAYHGFFHAPVAHAAVLLPGSLPLWSTLAAWLLLAERPTRQRWLGLALILAGGAAVGGSSFAGALGEAGSWRGDVLFVAASMHWAVYGVLCRRWQVGALAATAAIAVLALVLVVPGYGLAVWAGAVPSGLGHASASEIAFQAVYQGGLAMLVAGVAFTRVVTHYGPVRTTMFTAIVPPLAALAAVPLLGEPLAPAALLGLACVTAGLLVGSGIVDLGRLAVRAAR